MVTSASHLEIPLMTAERAWAHANQCKQETVDAPYRIRRQVVTRLAKAAMVSKARRGQHKISFVELRGISRWAKNLAVH